MCGTKGIPRIYFEALVVSVLLATFARAYLIQGVRISSGSMENALAVGDHLLVNRFAYLTAPSALEAWLPTRQARRGDLLLHRHPGNPGTLLVKRCVGLPGERIQVAGGRVLVDGRPLDESAYETGFVALDQAPIQVPPDHYYVLGDRRDLSLDSRDWGAVSADLVLGRPFFAYWSWQASAPTETGPIQKLRDLGANFFSGTRWDRTGRVVR